MEGTDLDKLIEELNNEEDSTTVTEGDSFSEAEGRDLSTPQATTIITQESVDWFILLRFTELFFMTKNQALQGETLRRADWMLIYNVFGM